MTDSTSLLLVEDDELDVEAFRRMLRKLGLECELHVANDGADALESLRSRVNQTHEIDQIVVLDLNMPGMNGHEFLAELRSDVRLRPAIVFVLTSSEHQRDVQMAYEQSVAGYFLKSNLAELVASMSHFLGVVKTPRPVPQ